MTDLPSPLSNGGDPLPLLNSQVSSDASTTAERITSPVTTGKDTETRSSFLSSSRKDLLHISTDEYFSAEEGEEARQNSFVMSYNADPGGSIRREDGEDMIATVVSVKTGEFFVDQASSGGSQVEQQECDSYTAEAGPAVAGNEASSFARVRSDVQEWVNNQKISVGSTEKAPVDSAEQDATACQRVLKASPTSTTTPTKPKAHPISATSTDSQVLALETTTTSTGSKPVLGKVLQVMVPKLPHKCLSRELHKLKSSSRSSSPTVAPLNKDASLNKDPIQAALHINFEAPEEKSIGEGSSVRGEEEEEEEECENDHDVGGVMVKHEGRSEVDSKDPTDEKQDRPRGKQLHKGVIIKRLKKRDFVKSRREVYQVVKVEQDVVAPDMTPCSSNLGMSEESDLHRSSISDYNPPSARSRSSSNDDITFSDVASNVIGNSPPPVGGRNSKERSSSRDPLPAHSANYALKRANNLTHGPNSPGVFQFGSDDDFDTPPTQPSHPKASTSSKKKKKKFLSRVSSDEDVKPVSQPAAIKSSQKSVGRGATGETSKGVGGSVGGSESYRKQNRGQPDKKQPDKKQLEKVVENNGSDVDLFGDSDEGIEVEPSEGVTSKQEGSPTMPTSPLNLSIELNPRIKLGKHRQGPHSKGKEKAPGPPNLVQCSCCGKDIDWRNQKVHAHPSLNVLTCHVSLLAIYT